MDRTLIARLFFASALLFAASGTHGLAVAQGRTQVHLVDKAQISGVWIRTGEPMFDPVPGGMEGKPIARLRVDSKDADEIMAGDWDNPILRLWARDIVKSEIALKHVFQADDSVTPKPVY